jgi:hypothetical protein
LNNSIARFSVNRQPDKVSDRDSRRPPHCELDLTIRKLLPIFDHGRGIEAREITPYKWVHPDEER